MDKMVADHDNGAESPTPSAIKALRQEQTGPRGTVERTNTSDMKAERDDLKEAAEQSLNVIVDIALDGTIRWASSSWTDVVGTPVESVQDKPFTDLLLSNKDGFVNAVESMKKDDSKSRLIRFQVKMGELSILKQTSRKNEEQPEEDIAGEDGETTEQEQVLNLEGQGIMVYDRSSGGDSHVRSKLILSLWTLC